MTISTQACQMKPIGSMWAQKDYHESLAAAVVLIRCCRILAKTNSLEKKVFSFLVSQKQLKMVSSNIFDCLVFCSCRRFKSHLISYLSRIYFSFFRSHSHSLSLPLSQPLTFYGTFSPFLSLPFHSSLSFLPYAHLP